MKKKLLSALSLLMLYFGSIAQTNIANYTFTSSVGSYVPLTGATTFTNSWDDVVSASIPLGGSFTFGGVSYSACVINSNGYIYFGAAVPSSTTNYTPISTLNTLPGVISGFACDGANSTMAAASPLISYMNVGSEFVVEFKDHATYGGRGSEMVNFQIRLNLTTNQIKIVYGSVTVPNYGETPQVGLRGNTTTWASNVNNLLIGNVPANTTCNWSNAVTSNNNSGGLLYNPTNTAVIPVNGLTFAWDAPVGTLAPVRVFSAVSSIGTTSAVLGWTSPTGATQYNIQYRVQGACGWTNFSGNPVSVVTPTLTGLTASTIYQIRVQSSNGTNNAIWSHIPNAGGGGNGYVAAGTFSTLANGCTGMPSAGTVPASFSICPNTSIVITNTSTNTGSGITYTWMQAPASTGPWTNVSTGSGFNTQSLTTASLASSTFYQLVVTCTNSAQSATTSVVSVNTASTTINTVPYFEGFEGITSNDQLPNCSWSASSLGSICKTYTAATSSYNQFANTGSKFASFHYGTNTAGDYFYTNGIQLNAGTTYSASTFYIADGLSGWSQLSLLYGTSQSTTGLVNIASVTGNITNTTYSLLANTFTVPTSGIYYIAVKAIGNSTPWYLTWDDLSVTAPPICSGAPAANSAVSSQTAVICPGGSANITLANTYTAGGLSYQWLASTTGSTGVYSAVAGATTSAYSPTNINVTTWYEAVITCATGPASTTSTPVAVNIASTTINTVPYFEGFEGLAVNNDLPNCSWLTTNTITCQTYTSTPGSYNRVPHTGSKFAAFRWSTTTGGDYFFTNGIQLNAGTTYSASSFYINDGTAGFTEFAMLYGTSQSTTGLVSIASVTGAITNTVYAQLANTFTVPTSGIYYIAVKGNAPTSAPWYLTWDDLSLTVVPTCTAASGGTVTPATMAACNGQSVSLTSTGATIGTGVVYQWQVGATPTGPFTNVTGGNGANTTTYNTAALATGAYYYVLQTTCTTASLTGVSNQVTVTINPIPTASASANGPLCSGQTLNLTGSTNIGTSFTWAGPNTYTSNTQSPSITNVPANASGVYTLMVSTPNCTSTPATVSVNINATPTTITVTPASSQICGSGSATLSASGGLIPATFAFGTQANQNTASTAAAGYPGPYSAYYGGQKMQVLVLASELSAAGFVANSPINSIQFPVVSFGSNWGSSITNNQSFQVNAGLTTVTNLGTSFLTGLTNVAPATNFTPTVGYNNTHSFSTPLIWDGTSNVVLETTFSNNFFGGAGDLVVSYNSPTTFTATLVYRADSQTPAAMAAATGISYSYLSRPDFKLNGLAISSYSWNPASTLSSSTGSSVVATPTTSTIYTVSVANGSCSVNANTTVSVTPVPSVSIVASNTAVCAGSAATFTASGATTYSWNTTATTSTITVNPTVPTTYTVTGANGTCTSVATKSIAVNALPSVSLSVSNGTLCTTSTGGSTVTLTGSPASGAYSGTNVTGNVFTPATSGTFTPAYSFTNSTTGCAGTATTSIVVSVCTGINNKTATSLTGLLVYPNPNTGEFTVELNNGSTKNIQVLDVTGRIVLSDASAHDKMNFNINNLANGVYYVKIQSNNTVEVLKIVKQ